METVILYNIKAHENKALCGADVPIDNLTGVDEYRDRRKAVRS